ncbi:hypothetical protein V2J09_009475 [Rumex salicifolius]
MNLSGDGFSINGGGSFSAPNPKPNPPSKKRRNQPGTPDPDAEVMALSPKTLMATNRFICEICNKGFQRDQNLQLHRRGHNLPWKLRQRSNKEQVRKKVYICPEVTCVHHHPSRALGDLTGIKKHFSRKHGEKKWKCDKCSKKYAVQSDWKAHSKTCEISARANCSPPQTNATSSCLTFKTDPNINSNSQTGFGFGNNLLQGFQDPDSLMCQQFNPIFALSAAETAQMGNGNVFNNSFGTQMSNQQQQYSLKEESSKKIETLGSSLLSSSSKNNSPPAPMSATALLQRAAQMGSTRSSSASSLFANSFGAAGNVPSPSGFNPISSSSINDSNSNHQRIINEINDPNPYQQQQQQQQQVMMQLQASNNQNESFSAAMAMHMGSQLDQLMSRSCPTRDFLGVGGNGYPFSPLEFAGFPNFTNAKGSL